MLISLQIVILISIIYNSNGQLTSQGTYRIVSAPIPAGYTWYEAESYCNRVYGTSLATVLDATDNSELVSGLNTYKGNIEGNVWIGWRELSGWLIWAPCTKANCVGTDWKCYARDEVYSSWHLSEAKFDASATCGGIKQSNSKWHDRVCTTKRDFVCNSNTPTARYKDIGSTLCMAPTSNPTQSPTPSPTSGIVNSLLIQLFILT